MINYHNPEFLHNLLIFFQFAVSLPRKINNRKMSHNLLKGKRGIIFGALDEKSIAWKIAQRAHTEGATFVLTNTSLALRMGTINQLAEECKAPIIPADVTVVEDLEVLFTESVKALGGKLDFVLHSVGMSPNVRKKRPYNDLSYGYFQKTVAWYKSSRRNLV